MVTSMIDYHKRISDSLEKGDYLEALQCCQELELLTCMDDEKDRIHWLKVQMALYFVVDDVDNARHLWRRLPVFAKEPGGEVASLWEVGKCLWSRDMEGAHAQLRKISWDPSISPVIEVVRQHLVDRQLALISRGYATIPLKFVAAMLGCDTAKAEHECVVRGWDIGEGGEEKSVKPQPCGADRQRVEAATPWHLLSMAEHITFLEQRSIG